jgi:hypothetical protein
MFWIAEILKDVFDSLHTYRLILGIANYLFFDCYGLSLGELIL